MTDSISQKIKSPEELKKRYQQYRIHIRLLGEEKSEIDTYCRFLKEEENWTLQRIADQLSSGSNKISRQRVGKMIGGRS